ncbi:pPIWI_RE_Y domain-containing protein [Streptomyces griseus]
MATAVVHLSHVDTPGAFSLPYPESAQSALNSMVLTCLLLKADSPGSVPELVDWCAQRTVDNWVFPIPPNVAPPGTHLVDTHTRQPTQLCYEWADGDDTGLGRTGQETMDAAAAICREEVCPHIYHAFRELLIKSPVLTGRELATLAARGKGLELLQQQIQTVYLPAPVHHMNLVTRTYTACGRCRFLLHRTVKGNLVCERDACRNLGPVKRGREYRAGDSGGVFLLIRPLRQWVASPGQVELRLAKTLEGAGATVRLWPSYGAYGMHVALPGGRSWAVEIKDWASGALLGRTAALPPQDPPYERCVWAIPRGRLRAHPSYGDEFLRHRTGPDLSGPDLVNTDDLPRAVRHIAARSGGPDLPPAEAEPPFSPEGLF